MKNLVWRVVRQVPLRLGLMASVLLMVSVQSVWAETAANGTRKLATDSIANKASNSNPSVSSATKSVASIPRLKNLNHPATTVKDWIAQVEAATVQVINVRLDRISGGLEITLETGEGKPLQIDASKFRTEGNALIADLPNALLALPDAPAFNADNPTGDIANIRIVQLDTATVRVSITGNNAPPKSDVTLKTGGLAYSLNPEADEPDEELVVTGERNGYRVPNTSVGTRTDTPLRDIPQSIQVIPQQVLKDQQVYTINEALRNITGVSPSQQSDRTNFDYTARGFASSTALRNGLPDPLGSTSSDLTNVERVEFLKGPASVLFGQGSPGGILNIITKQPLRDPFYAIEATFGNYDFYRGAVDLSGPLNDSKTVSYRLNTSYLDRQGFTDFFQGKVFLLAPVIRWEISPKTNLTLEADYTDAKNLPLFGLPAVGTVLSNPNGKVPRNRNINEPDAYQQTRTSRVGYRLEHQFSDNWSLRNAFQVGFGRDESRGASASGLESDNRTLDRGYGIDNKYHYNAYNLTTDIIGKFSTGSIQHQLLFGVDLSRFDVIRQSGAGGTASPLDLYNPVYGQLFGPVEFEYSLPSVTDALGVYVQDQITLAPNLKLLLGGRFDTSTATNRDQLANTESSQSDDAFSPRVGIVYQPIPPISLYASYSRSFTPASGTDFNGNLFQPERGTQYEVGVKADISNKLSATLAFYNLTRTNISTEDTRPGVPPGQFSIQIGEQRSRGIELNLAGEILPGWNIYAGYAYTDARITEDNTLPVGNQLYNTPENAFNLWTTYKIQRGPLQGFGVGVGFFFVGDRQGDLENTFKVPSYVTTDVAIFYKRGQLGVQVNFKNLFNVDYFETTRDSLRVFYGAPFTVQGTISWEF